MSGTNFSILNNAAASSARRATLKTAHGTIDTPVFMPVGTAGAVKGITPDKLKETGAAVVLANTYHLMLRPGAEIIEKLGGLHKFMSWPGPVLTDSGGYQVFSLSSLNKINDDGVEFASHIDGKKFFLDPAAATKIQNQLGADIIMCFDECTPFPCEQDKLKRAVERSVRWAKICKESHQRKEQLLFGIVQGGTDLSLRIDCAERLAEMDFDGYAIGGLGVGEGHTEMIKTTAESNKHLPQDKPRYLMGVGTPADIIAAVADGVDMFDCVLPTRNGRNAYAFTESGPMRLRNSIHTEKAGPVEPGCECYCCRNFTRAAVRHFFNCNEMLGPILLSLHNLTFYQKLMADIRTAIENGNFDSFSKEKLKKYKKLYK